MFMKKDFRNLNEFYRIKKFYKELNDNMLINMLPSTWKQDISMDIKLLEHNKDPIKLTQTSQVIDRYRITEKTAASS